MSSPASTRPVGWVGWAFFAAAILFLNGMFTLTQGLVLLFGPDAYRALPDDDVFVFVVTGLAWWNIILGVFLLVAGGALFSGRNWARIVAVIFAVLSAVGQLLLIPAQPFWALIIIAVDIFVIYALVVHGDELGDEA